MTTEKEIERLYGEMQGWENATALLIDLAKQAFLAQEDKQAMLLRQIAWGPIREAALKAEDAWRGVEPHARPRKE